MTAVTIPDDAPRPPDVGPGSAGVDALLEWAGQDVERLHVLFWREMNYDPRRRSVVLLQTVTGRLGSPAPDMPAEELLPHLGKAGLPPARALLTEQSRPEWCRRWELIAELERMVSAAGANATAVVPRVQSRSW